MSCNDSQKAPSAKRCIKTLRYRRPNRSTRGRVRKHRAPKGALRPTIGATVGRPMPGQKAPSAKRCIKTVVTWGDWQAWSDRSESTERQKVH